MTRSRQFRAALTLVGLGLVLMVAGCLGGCAERTVYVDRVQLVQPSVAPSLLHCQAEPVPLGAKARQRDVAPYVLDVLAAGRDCRRKLGTVAERISEKPVPAPAEAPPALPAALEPTQDPVP